MVLTCKFQIKKVKRSVKKMLAKGNINYSKTIIFSEAEIEGAAWVEPREFRLDGIMYDVYRTDTVDGKLFHHCFEDQNESAWAELLLKSSNQDLPSNGKERSKQNPLKYLMKDISLHNDSQLLFVSYHLLEFQKCDIVGLKPQFIYSNIFSPPEA